MSDEKAEAEGTYESIGESMGDLLDGMRETTLEEDLADTGEETSDVVETPEGEGAEVVDDATPVDPFANAAPLSYTADKAQKSYDGILVAKDGRGLIPAAKLAEVTQRMSRHDHLESANKQLYGQVQAFERLGGVRALESAHIESARKDAALEIMAAHLDFDNPDKLLALAFAAQEKDRSEFERLVKNMQDQTTIAQYKAKESWAQKSTQQSTQESTASQRAEITNNSISGSVDQWAAQFPSLTPADVQAAKAHFSRLGSAVVRQATPDEAQAAGVKPGELIVDHPVIFDWLKDRNEMRAEQAKTVATSTTKATENAHRLRAATPPKRVPSNGKRPTVPAEPAGESWQQQRDRLMSGGFTDQD